MFKKLLITLSLGFISLLGYSQSPYGEDVGNGKWTIIERIRSVKALKFADGTTQSTSAAVDTSAGKLATDTKVQALIDAQTVLSVVDSVYIIADTLYFVTDSVTFKAFKDN